MDNSPYKIISNKLYSSFTLKEVEHNSLPLKCGLCLVTPYPRVQHGKRGKESNFTVEKADKLYLS